MNKQDLINFPAVVLMLLLVFSAFTIQDWQVITSEKGRFKVLCPGDMIDTIKTIESRIGPIDYHTYFYQSKDKDADNLAYMVSYCDYPEFTVHSDSTELLNLFFNTTIETATESVSGELIYSTEIELAEYPGRLWRIDYADGRAFIKTKSYVVGNRYYSLQTITLKEKRLNISIDKFLDSFKLLD